MSSSYAVLIFLPIIIEKNTNETYYFLNNISPFTAKYTITFIRQILTDYFCIKAFSLDSIGNLPKPGKYIFNYLELFYFDDYCMPYFDDYLLKTEPELAEISKRIMKLAIYYDYSSRFYEKLGKVPNKTCESIYSMIQDITNDEISDKDNNLLNELENEDIEKNNLNYTTLNETKTHCISSDIHNVKISDKFDIKNDIFKNYVPDTIINEDFNSEQSQNLRTRSIRPASTQNEPYIYKISEPVQQNSNKKSEHYKLSLSKTPHTTVRISNFPTKNTFFSIKKSTAYLSLMNKVKINSDIKNMEFHQPDNIKDLLIMRELDKLKDAFENYKQTVSFTFLYQKIIDYEDITTYVYHQAVIISQNRIMKLNSK